MSRERVAFRDAARFWVKLGFINFGGPAGQIAIMHDELVEKRRWISDGRFLHALNYCMLLPGPEAQQLAIYVGWLLHRLRGGLVAGIAFIAPSFFVILGLSWLYVARGDVRWVSGLFLGLAPAVVAVVAAASIRIGRRALSDAVLRAIAAAAFVAVFALHVAFPLVVLGAAFLGLAGSRIRPRAFQTGADPRPDGDEVAVADDSVGEGSTTPARRGWHAPLVLAVGLPIWILPLVAVALIRGPGDTLTEQAWLFARAALVTFGGAYAVLAYLNQAAVLGYGWLHPGQMVVGLGLAESTPGPLIMVVEFVGFVGAYQHPGELSPFASGLLGAVVATWATFVPCFIWIFAGAPFIERLRGNVRLSAALSAVTAAVVGVIVDLAITFASATLFDRVRTVDLAGATIGVPVWSSVDPASVAIAIAAFVALERFRAGVVPVVLASGLAGILLRGAP
jgi:chromate transporter